MKEENLKLMKKDFREKSSLQHFLYNTNVEQFSTGKKLPDGKYIVNHDFHLKGVRERIIEIKDSIVFVEKESFSQSYFFAVNHVVEKIN